LQLYVQRTRLIETVEKETSECAATTTSKKEYSVTSLQRSGFQPIIRCDLSRRLVDEILKEMSPQFAKLYSNVGRPSIAPERLLRSLLLQIFYSVRSERMLIEQLQYHLLFRWFVGMEMDEEVWNHAVFSKNRERLLNEEIAEGFFRRVIERAKPFMSDEHFTVDGTLIEAWASQKSFRRKDGKGNPPGAAGEVDFHGEKRKNETHESTTDPDARLFRKSKGSEVKLSYLGHVLMENRNGLLVQTFLTEANGRAERDAALSFAVLARDTLRYSPPRGHWFARHDGGWMRCSNSEMAARAESAARPIALSARRPTGKGTRTDFARRQLAERSATALVCFPTAKFGGQSFRPSITQMTCTGFCWLVGSARN
jgi:transposase